MLNEGSCARRLTQTLWNKQVDAEKLHGILIQLRCRFREDEADVESGVFNPRFREVAGE